jgi:hypothetical protein
MLLEALHTRFGFETVNQNVGQRQVRVVGRIAPEYRRNWVVGIQHLLSQEQNRPWSVDISRQYFLRNGVVVWGWRLIFQHEDIAGMCADIIATISNAPRARFEVEEQALPGVTGQRTMMTSGGKGAAPAGTPPLLVQRKTGA